MNKSFLLRKYFFSVDFNFCLILSLYQYSYTILIAFKYRSVFNAFPYFNVVQSTVFEDAFYTDKHLVVCAPTGSGKTVIFELCIVRLLILVSDLGNALSRYKVVYMAPVKSLCHERFEDWRQKFECLGASCMQLTGDTENEDYFELQKYTIILTTPEKWDSITRLWKNNKNLVQTVKLLLIDEIHLLNEEERGATMEAALSRMKTIQNVLLGEARGKPGAQEPSLRFVAVSATFPNAEDVTEWLGMDNCKGVAYKMNDNLRPVHLRKVVLGYPCSDTLSEFRFDLNLSYKLGHVIQSYSEGKPTLVFCATRKSVIQTACILAKSTHFVNNAAHKQQLIDVANSMHDTKLRECLLNGIGFHHAGLSVSDRRMIEEMFVSARLHVLISTSTLAMGVNFPAHLVVIKSTAQYAAGSYKEYSETQLLQMIGRAGRPQFDSSATAVIMTKNKLKEKYENLVSGKQLIESSLHKHIVEHLNAEIVLGTITDTSIAMEWLKATYLYQRVFKNPKHYGINMELSKGKIERKLQDMCLKELNGLRKYKLIYMDDDSFDLRPTDTGKLMARYYLAFETMKSFSTLTGNENLPELLALVSSSKEFEDIQLRVNEKKFLNDLNKSKTTSIRFPLQGKIKTRAMKINCLTQATFGCLPISEPAFNQDIAKIFRSGIRVAQCLAEYLTFDTKGFSILYNAVLLAKCFKARLWENSKHVARQLDKIGVTLSTVLVNAGISSFESLANTNPRELELILNRNPPFGSILIDNVKHLPNYGIEAEQSFSNKSACASICINVFIRNRDDLLERRTTYDHHGCTLLVGNEDNNIILIKKIKDFQLLEMGLWSKRLEVPRAQKGDNLHIHWISDSYVGLDVHKSFVIQYDAKNLHVITKETDNKILRNIHQVDNSTNENQRACYHKCLNKIACGHFCCKTGVQVHTTVPKKTKVENFMDQLHNKMNAFPSKKVKLESETKEKFLETTSNSLCKQLPEECLTPSLDEEWLEEMIMDEDITEDVPAEENNDLETISFDLNLDGMTNEDMLSNDTENVDEKQNESTTPAVSSLNMNAQPAIEQREVWPKEKWIDPVAAGELLEYCVNFLSGKCE
ncbi:probable ATP-dependent DNA helicase HFM1 [Argiope bruennichi]|uniref:probable ATP-dependent DNA helicase HFM1 n=1 Tax=Argiope bruennichi TaxID=94029 RepID=UPI00249518A9|nr:probable ATP-dependent DNA helicase HFM1 [Argiope bruennichi]